MRPSLIYPLVRRVLRATVRRHLAREFREQLRMRGHDPQESWRHGFEQSIAFANRMSSESPGYRELLRQDRIAVPVTAGSWSTLPLLTKDAFRRDTESWYGKLAHKEHVTWTVTSGSTGVPFEFPLSKASRTAEIAGNELNLLAVGWNPLMRQATIKVEPTPARGARAIYRMIMGNREIGFPAADFRAARTLEMVERIRRERISYLRGYSRTISLFAREILRQELFCPITLVTTFGEALPAEDAEVIERAFGGKVYRDYGGSEAMHIGFECREQRGYHVDLARFFIEILRENRPARDGETGDIVVTAFRNAAMPLVRYRIGDIGRWATGDDPCLCGNRFPILAEVVGRSADEVVTTSGHVVDVHIVSVVFKYAHEHVAEYKVIQKERDRFDVLWVARHDRAVDHLPALQQELVAKAGGQVSFDWHQVAEISSERSGKRRILVPLK